MWRLSGAGIRTCLGTALAMVALAALLPAQEGHPLSGTWSGDWGSDATGRKHVTFVMNWDGKAVTGLINPGPDAIPITGVSIDYSNWTVRIEAGNQASGKVVAEGRIQDLASPHRSIRGDLHGSTEGDFQIRRD